jgi:hypothetical protein
MQIRLETPLAGASKTSRYSIKDAGTGVASGTAGDKAEFVNCSFDVKIEGNGVCHHSEPMTQNSKNAI